MRLFWSRGPAPTRLLIVLFVLTTVSGLQAANNYVTPYAFTTFAGGTYGTQYGVVLDSAGNLYVSDGINGKIKKIPPAGVVSTLVTLSPLPNLYGFNDSWPKGVAVDSANNLYVADSNNNRIVKITPLGAVTTLAGNLSNNPDLPDIPGILGRPVPNPSNAGSADGPGSTARFNQPIGVALDGTGNVYVADWGNNTIRKITPTGTVSTLAGTAGPAQIGIYQDGTGPAAHFWGPTGVATDAIGNVYVAESANNLIRKITPGGVVTTLAGTSAAIGSADGIGTAARFNFPSGLALDGSGNIYVADTSNNLIRKIAGDGTVTTLAGLAGSSSSTDGTGSAARFSAPYALTVDGAGNLYVADGSIRKGMLALVPTFTTQPANQTVVAGSSVMLTADASGTPTPTFQWQKNGVNISDATGSTYTITSVTAGDAANYTAIATNPAGSATSNTATLSVIDPPSNAIVSITVE